jgi:hypothetical protein
MSFVALNLSRLVTTLPCVKVLRTNMFLLILLYFVNKRSKNHSVYSISHSNVCRTSSWRIFKKNGITYVCKLTMLLHLSGQDSSISVATCYGLDGPGIDSQWRQDFLYPSRPALGPIQPPIKWVLCLSQG